MANSIEVKLGVDTKDFSKDLKKLDREINSTQKTAQALDKSLDLEFDSGRAVKAQQQYQKALAMTEQKADAIRKQLKYLEDSGKVDTTQYQSLQTELIKAETKAVSLKDKLEQVKKVEIEQLSKKFTDVGSNIEKAGQKLAGFSAAAAGVIVAGAAVGKTAAKTGADIDDMSQRFDVSAETIQRWQYLAMQGGVDVDVFTKALIRMRAATADMAAGTSNKATDIMSQLGIDPKQFKSQEDMFDSIVLALAAVEDSTLQTAYANEIFGDKIATDMLPYINAGAADLAKWNAEFDAMPSLSSEAAAELANLDDSFNRLDTTMKLATAQLGLALAPIIERVVVLIEEKAVPALESLAEWFGNLSPGTQDAILGLLGVIAVAAPLLILIGKISTGIGGLIKLFGKMNKQALITAGGVAALGAALALGLNLIADWKNMSTIEKILKSLAMAALIAAGAVAVFHASWSLGIAIGAIAAGIVAAVAAVKAAEKDITGGTEASDYVGSASSGITGGNAPSEQDLADIDSWTKTAPQGGSSSTTINSSEDNSSNTYNIYIDSNEYVSAEEVADIVSKRIATLAQSRG